MQPLIPYFAQPELHLGPIPLYGFGVMVALGFLVGGNIAMKRAERLGLDPDAINQLIGWLVAGTFIGGHLGYLFMYAPHELSDPMKVINVFDGLSSFGGFFACVPISFYFFKHHKLPLWPYVDSLAIGLGMGWFLGRGGCFLAHDHVGPQTDFYLGVYGICPGGDPTVACHDLGLYESLFGLAVFCLFLLLDRVPRVPGFYVALLGVLYAPVRFGLDFLRPESTDMRWYGLTGAQWGASLFFVIAVWGLWRRIHSEESPIWVDREAVIATLSRAIEASPDEAQPYIDRALQYKAWGNRTYALADLNQAEAFGAEVSELIEGV